MNTNNTQISATFPFESKFLNIKGSKIHYIEEGKGDPILFIHGTPTSSYLWRNIIPHVSSQGRCIALDLIGMGKSDQPDINYGFTDGYEYMVGFIDKLGLKNITLVVHDWGSMLGFHYANLNRANVKAIAFMESVVQLTNWKGMPFSQRMAIKMVKTPIIGALMVKRANIFIKKMIPDLIMRKLTTEEMEHYAAPYPTYKSRHVLLRWPEDAPYKVKPQHVQKAVISYSKWLAETEIPMLCLYVTPGVGLQAVDREFIKTNFRNTKMVNLGEGTHFLQEDYPHEIGTELTNWYQMINN